MPDAFKLLAQGQLGTSAATLYTAPAGPATGAVIRHITVVNNDTSARTFALFRTGTANANRITVATMLVPAGGMQEWGRGSAIALSPSETLSGVGSVATQLTYTISGDETS